MKTTPTDPDLLPTLTTLRRGPTHSHAGRTRLPRQGGGGESGPRVSEADPDSLAPDTAVLHELRRMLVDLLDAESPQLDRAISTHTVTAAAELLHGWAGAAAYCGTPRLALRIEILRELLAAGAVAAGPVDWQRVEVHARALQVDLNLLRIALAAPNRP